MRTLRWHRRCSTDLPAFAALPESTIIVHGSLAFGDYVPGKSDLDLLVLSDAPTDGLVEAVQAEWKLDPTNLDLRVVAYDVAATPTRTPRMRLYIGVHDGEWEVERDIDEADLVVEFPMNGSIRLVRTFSAVGRRSEMTRRITSSWRSRHVASGGSARSGCTAPNLRLRNGRAGRGRMLPTTV